MLHKSNKNIINDDSTLKVIIFASLIIIISVLIMGITSYTITNKAIVNKLKSKDLIYIAQSIASKIDGRIERAKETSITLSKEPSVVKWIKESENDNMLGEFAKTKIADIAKNYDYSNSFIVSAVTNHYWAEDGKLIDTMSYMDPDDSWFFDAITSKQPISIVIDYNKERKDTFVFVNALMGDIDNPIAVTGVGLNLKDISSEFQSYKFGEKSNMWLIDKSGTIYISEDVGQTMRNIRDFIPSSISSQIISNASELASDVLEYTDANKETYDLIYRNIKSTDWKLVLQIPRSDSVSIVESIKFNTAAASIITILLIVLIFYLVSNKIANPYKRALLLSQELEAKVNERTRELNEKNSKLIDSIEYAKIIQESILPPLDEIEKLLKEYFIIWKPKDIVGGDFYWIKAVEGGYLIAVGDCTGHGVPGALMTMTAYSILNNIVTKICSDNPAIILKQLNQIMKNTLHRKNNFKSVDDGVDIGIIYIKDNKNIIFSGAKISLYIKNTDLEIIKGDKKTIGYRKTDDNYEFTNHYINIDKGSMVYMTTDGYLDQNGGKKDYSLGKKRFQDIINNNYLRPFSEQKQVFEEELKNYMNDVHQRDDITVLGFKIK